MKKLLVIAMMCLAGCGGAPIETQDQQNTQDTEDTPPESTPDPVLLGTYSYRPEHYDAGLDYLRDSEAWCDSSCWISMWPTIRVYQDGEDLSVKDTNGTEVISGSFNSDGSFDYSFQFSTDSGTETINCTAKEMTFGEHICPTSANIIKSTCSSSLGSCKLYYEKL